MTPEEQQKIKINLQEIAEILYKNTPVDNLQSFESVELSVREHLIETVAPEINGFFFNSAAGKGSGRKRTIKSCVGEITLSSKQAQRLGVKKGSRLSPNLEKCCLLLVGNESFANAERDLKMLTGIYVPHSTQHRLLERYKLPEPETTEKVEALSIDGGNVRLRTHEGEESVWRNYKAVKLHGQVAAAFFQNNADLVAWVNSQIQSEVITCLGDGHDGVWNLFNQIGTTEQRREVLDWYHLRENLHKVGGSLKRLRRVESQLWQGSTVEAIAEFIGVRAKESKNFQNYLRKHQSRIPDYHNYQNQGIDIGSGAVESLIKQIGARIKIVGAQWNEKNVPQILRLRCAYLNNEIKMGRYA